MSIRKPIAFFVLALIAATAGLLVVNRPALGADVEPATSPRSLLLIAIDPPRLLPAAGNLRDNDPFTPLYAKYLGLLPATGDHRDDGKRELETQCVLIKSRLVVSAALRQPEISQLPAIKNQPDPIAWLQQILDVINLKDTEVLQVSLSPRSGASGKDQAAIINAVVNAYMEEVVNVDLKRREDRLGKLKQIKQSYADILKERRETVRKLSSSLGRKKPLTGPEENSLLRRRDNLLAQRLKLRLDRAEAETVLARRKKAAGAETDPRRKEIAQLEDRLAVLTAHEKVLQEELEHVSRERQNAAAVQGLDLEDLKEDIAQMQDVARKVGAEVEALNIELEAPPRVRVIEEAVPPLQ